MILIKSVLRSARKAWKNRKVKKPDTHFFKFTEKNKLYNKSYFHAKSTDYAEIIKASDIKDVLIINSYVPSGYEDSIDFVRATGVIKHSIIAQSKAGGSQGITIKGGSEVIIGRTLFMGNWPFAMISLGDFTIYDAVTDIPKSKLTILPGLRACGENSKKCPIIIISINGIVDNKDPDNKNIKIVQIPSWLVKIYFLVCKLVLSKERKEEAKRNLANE